jgi:hypothetical protein
MKVEKKDIKLGSFPIKEKDKEEKKKKTEERKE